MRETARISTRFAVAVAIATLAGTSAFADSRHPKTTERGERADAAVVVRERGSVQQAPDRIAVETPARAAVVRPQRGGVRQAPDGGAADTPARAEVVRPERGARGGESLGVRSARPAEDRPVEVRTEGRGRGNEHRDRYGDRPRGRGHDDVRGGRGYSSQHGKRAPHYAHGRVSKVKPYKNGYRVWVVGAPYPYYVPNAYWRPGYFGVGMTIRIGGYYNPSGWYDYYGDYECASIAEERLRGIVESVDYMRGEILLDVVGGGYVTVKLRDRHERIYPGDYVVAYGDWNRWGRFVAFDVDVIDREYRW